MAIRFTLTEPTKLRAVQTSTNIVVAQRVTGVQGEVGPRGFTGKPGLQPVFTRQGNLEEHVGQSRLYVDREGLITSVRAGVGTAPTGSAITLDVLNNGVTVLSEPLTIAAGSHTAIGLLENPSVAAGDFLSVNIITTGSINPGADLTVSVTIE